MLSKYTSRLVVYGITLAHLLFLGLFHEPAYDSPDAHGYFVQGKIIAETGFSRMKEESPVQLMGVHWLETDKGEFYSRYPTGLPILIAIVYKLFGPEGTIWINIFLTSFSLPLIFYFTRKWTSPAMGVVAMVLLAMNPAFNQYALNADSHAATMFFLLAGLCGLSRWDKTGKITWAILGGFLLGFVPIIRYPEALYGIGIAVYLILKLKNDKDALNGVIGASAGAAIPLVYAFIRNWVVFGAPWRTAYALTNEQTGFSKDFFLGSYSGYLDNLATNGLGPAFVLGLLGIAGMIIHKSTRSWGIMFAVIIAPITLLYMSYYFGNGSVMTMRFLLPTFPIYIVAACYAIFHIAQQWKVSPVWIGTGVAIFASLTAVPGSLRQLANESVGIRANAYTVKQMKKYIPEDSVLFIGRQLSQWAEFAGDWKLADDGLLAPGNRMMGINHPMFTGESDEDRPSPRQENRRVDVMERYANLSPEQKMDLVLDDALSWAGNDNDIYIIGDLFSIERSSGMLNPAYEWQFVADINLDEALVKDWKNSLVESLQGSVRGRLGAGSRPTVQRMMPMMQGRVNQPGGPGQANQPQRFRPQQDSPRNQRMGMIRQRPGGAQQMRSSPFQSQSSGILTIFKLVPRSGDPE